jgi:hypothetical protein
MRSLLVRLMRLGRNTRSLTIFANAVLFKQGRWFGYLVDPTLV